MLLSWNEPKQPVIFRHCKYIKKTINYKGLHEAVITKIPTENHFHNKIMFINNLHSNFSIDITIFAKKECMIKITNIYRKQGKQLGCI